MGPTFSVTSLPSPKRGKVSQYMLCCERREEVQVVRLYPSDEEYRIRNTYHD